MRPAICAPYRRAQRRPGPGSRVWKRSPSGGGRRKTVRTHASARSSSAASVQGESAPSHLGSPTGSPGGGTWWSGRCHGEPPQLARRSNGPHGAGAVPRTCPGQRDCIVTATGRATGDRADNAASPAMPSGTTGDVRSSERLTPAGRPSVDGSPSELPRLAQRLRLQRFRGGSLFHSGPVGGGPPAPSDAQPAPDHPRVWCGASPHQTLGCNETLGCPPVPAFVRRRARTSPCTAAPRRARRGSRSRRSPASSGPDTGPCGRRRSSPS